MQSPKKIAQKLHSIAGPRTYFIQFDFASYYDQFRLRGIIPSFFCFLGRDGNTHALHRLPMGFSLACAVAQSTTWQILNFEKRSTPFTCIDNVAFAGTLEEVHHDVNLFLERVLAIDATLNELSKDEMRRYLQSSTEEQRECIKSWHKDEFTFLGVSYSWKSKLKKVSEKTMDKLKAANSCLKVMDKEIAPRQLAAIIGLLRYASDTYSIALYDRFDLLAWTRRIGYYLQGDVKRWDSAPLALPDKFKKGLLDWFQQVLTHPMVRIAKDLPAALPTTIITDASGVGWGAVMVQGAHIVHRRGPWPSHKGWSAVAEPEAVWEAAKNLVSSQMTNVLILTDHLPLVYASLGPSPRSYHYNKLLLQLTTRFPQTNFYFQFIPGSQNVADKLSRGEDDVIEYGVARRFAGTGWDSALRYIRQGPPCSKCDSPCLPWQY